MRVLWRGVVWTALALLGTQVAEGQVTYQVFPVTSVARAAGARQPTGQTALVSLDVSDSTVLFVVNEILRQAHLQALDNATSPAFAKRTTVKIVREPAMAALATALRGTGLIAKMAPDGETVVIRAGVREGRVASGMIVGRVTDSASGAGLGGASVRVEGSKLSTVTSDSGHFTLRDVPSGDQVLTVRLFGYKPADRTVAVVDSERTTVRIVLVSIPTVLSGVVTTATGAQRKIEVGNDITTLNVDSIRQVAPITSVTDLLETRVPGLTVLHSSGTPGDPSRLRLRGAGSIQGNNDPVVIIDGIRVYASQSDARNMNLARTPQSNNQTVPSVQPVNAQEFAAPSPLDQIDPASIETIEVLKGPSATATYGSDAAGGVIVITTKHGRAGPTHWDLALADGINWIPGGWPTNYYRFGENDLGNAGNTQSLFCQWYRTGCTVDSVVAFQALNDSRYTVFGQGSSQKADLTVSGGTPTLTYSLTGSGSGDLGPLKLPKIEQQRYDSAYGATYGLIPGYLKRPDNYTTWGVGGALTALPTSHLRVTLQSSLFTSTQQQGSLQSAIPQLEGEYVTPALIQTSGALIQNDVERATDNSVSGTNAMSLHWQLTPWLPLDATGGINAIQRTDNTYIPFGINSSGPGTILNDTTGFYGLGRGSSHDQTLTAGTAIPVKLVTLAFGGNLYDQSTADVSVYTTQLAPGVSTPTVFLCGSVPCQTNQSTFGQRTYGWYVEPRLNVASKFFVSPGFRLDGGSGGSTSSGSVSGLSAFPKIDLSYVAVDRPGSHPLWGVVTLLRPRLAFGLAGTQPNPADKLRLFNVGSLIPPNSGQSDHGLGLTGTVNGCQQTVTLNDTTVVPAVCLNGLGNTQLRPERTREFEGGVDATLWQGRLSLTYTQYNKETQDAILSIPVAPSVASLGNIEKNIGVVRNTGTELTMIAILLQNRAVSWNVQANLSNNNSLVVRLNPGQAPICYGGLVNVGGVCQGTRIVAGYPLFGEWALPIVSVADANHDGVIQPTEYRVGDSAIYVGQPTPKYQLNLTTGLTLFNGRLNANATFAYMNGLTQDNQGALYSGALSLLPNAPNTPLATQAAIVAAGGGDVNGLALPYKTSIGLFQTVNTFRFSTLSVNYSVPRAISSWFRVPQMTLALQGSNLGLRTNYRGKDPNVNAFSTVSAGDEAADLGQIPEPRTWWLRINLGN